MKSICLSAPSTVLTLMALSLPLFGFTCGNDPVPIGSTDASDAGGDAGTPCQTNSNCTGNDVCGFPIADACMAHGVCIPGPDPTAAHCESFIEACGCDGSQVGIACDFPSGYAPAPIQSENGANCQPQRPTACTTDTNCASGQVCGFAIADACMAQGVCITFNPSAGPTCNSIREACGCDGSMVGVACDFPNGYAPAAISGFAPCDGGTGAQDASAGGG